MSTNVTTGQEEPEKYLHGHHQSVVTAHSARNASETAAFVLQQLSSPMRLLDFGCGPGTVTIDLAEHLLPAGSAVGIDLSENVIELARSTAAKRQVSNVSFEVNNIYATGYDKRSFDVVYAHQVLQHLSDPVKALTEAHRVLIPGGICAVREVDWGTNALWPQDRQLVRFFEIYNAVAERNGGNVNAGRSLKKWFVEAGFTNIAVTTSTWSFSDDAGLKWWGKQWSERILNSDIATQAIEYGIASENELAKISRAWLDWTETPGAFFAFIQVEVIGETSKPAFL